MGAVLSGSDVVEIIRVYVNLEEDAGRLRGYCPLCHKDDLSFEVDTEQGLWRCRRCGHEGDVYQLFARIRRVPIENAERFVSRVHESIQRSAQKEPAVIPASPQAWDGKPVAQFRARTNPAEAGGTGTIGGLGSGIDQEPNATTQAQAVASSSAKAAGDTGKKRAQFTSPGASRAERAAPIDARVSDTLHIERSIASSAPDAGGSNGALSPRPDVNWSPPPTREPASAMPLGFSQIVDRVGASLAATKTSQGLVAVRDGDRGEPEALVFPGSNLDKHDALALDRLMREALGAAGHVLGRTSQDHKPPVVTLRATRHGEPMEVLWSPMEEGEHRFNIVLVLAQGVSEGLALRRLRSCLSSIAGQ